VNARISIPRNELRFSFVRSSGPGGQNVNKVASKAILRWPVVKSSALPDAVRKRFLDSYKRRINERGEILLASQRYRNQARNVADCIAKLQLLVLAVASAPRERKSTALPRAARESRLRAKRATAEKKRSRRIPPQDE
jgi:ribosome-associated protein